MKRFIIIIALLTGLISGSTRVHAQTPMVDLIFAGDSTQQGYCTLPDTVHFFYYGYAPGYLPTDSIRMDVNYGDGTIMTYYSTLSQGPTFYGNISHIYTQPGAYSVQFIATGPDGSSDTLVDSSILVSSACADISGRVYLDSNSDCIYNSGDIPVQVWVNVYYNGNQVAGGYSNAMGEYFIAVPSGFTYTVDIYNPQLTISCPVGGSYTVTSLPSSGNHFALECDPGFDYTGHISGQGFRVNNTTWIWLNAFNEVISCAAPNATVTLTLDPMLSYVNSTVAPASTTLYEVVYTPGQLTGLSLNSFTTGVQLLTSPNAVIGDTLCLTLTVEPLAGDADTTNNVYTVCLPVRNSCDPNEKYEIHAGAGTAAVAPGTRLDYTIMFQNIGNDVAYEVVVLDELDPNLDLTTLTVTGFSHQPAIYLTNGLLKFEFKNINLAAAAVNEPQSHGYVSYSIHHVNNVANGTVITNDAEIYFDFNAPIITNTVTHIIDQSVGVSEIQSPELVIFPNPTSDNIRVTGLNTSALLSIYDVTGRIVMTRLVSDHQMVNLKMLVPGMYVVSIETGTQKQIHRLIVK